MLPGAARRAAHRVALARPQRRPAPPASGSRGRAGRRTLVFLAVVAAVLVLTLVGTFMRGPYWQLLLAVAGVAGHSDEALSMEQRTNSPYPRRDRPVLAVVGLLLVVSTVLFTWNDREHEWRYYQYDVQAGWWPRSSAPRRPRTVPTGLAADLGAGARPRRPLRHVPPGDGVEGVRDRRGAVPHAPGRAAEERIRSSDSAARRATAGRAGRSTPSRRTARSSTGRSRCSARTLGEAYSLVDNKHALMQMNCNVCHRYDRETKGADVINLAKQLVREKGCRACHVINGRGGTIGPDLTFVGDKAPEQYDYGRLSGQKTAFAWHVAHLKDPRALVADTVMPNFHLTTQGGAGARDAGPVVAAVAGAGRPRGRRAAHRSADAGGDGRRGADEDRARRVVREDRLLRLPLDLGRSASRARRRSAPTCRPRSRTCRAGSAGRSTTSSRTRPARCRSCSRARSSSRRQRSRSRSRSCARRSRSTRGRRPGRQRSRAAEPAVGRDLGRRSQREGAAMNLKAHCQDRGGAGRHGRSGACSPAAARRARRRRRRPAAGRVGHRRRGAEDLRRAGRSRRVLPVRLGRALGPGLRLRRPVDASPLDDPGLHAVPGDRLRLRRRDRRRCSAA